MAASVMSRRVALALGLLTGVSGAALSHPVAQPAASVVWMDPATISRQQAAGTDTEKEAIASRRADQLIGAMTLEQKMRQLTGDMPSTLPELPQCFGGRHVSGIPELAIPTFRITNGPVGVGQNDCISGAAYQALPEGREKLFAPYTHPSSAQATALPSAMAVAASFDPQVATAFGEVVAAEMRSLALHVFEAPGMNLARLPILGRNFEYFGEDPFLSGTMAVAETKSVQNHGLIAMAKHFVANEQETNRMTIRETVDEQVLRELYLIPFEMSVKDGKVASLMCSYNYVNGLHACENSPLLTGVLRDEWGFTGYVQSDFFAMKTTVPTLAAGMDHEMPTPIHWSSDKLKAALASGELNVGQIDRALKRRYTQMFKAGVFDRPLVQTPIDFVAGGRRAHDIGTRAAVLLQNNGGLPLAKTAKTILLVGKASQVYAQQAIAGGSILGRSMGAGGGSSDVVPHRTIAPIDGLRDALHAERLPGEVKMLLIDDGNTTATLDGKTIPFSAAIDAMAAADSVVVMAGTNAEEGSDRATFIDPTGHRLAAGAGAGLSLDWYTAKPNTISTTDPAGNTAHSSQTVSMLAAIVSARSKTDRSMPQKTVLVLKDNASVAMDPRLLGSKGPSILEVWFPGQEDGAIVADLLLGKTNPSGKLPVTFPIAGRGFLDGVSAEQFPGVLSADGKSQSVTYSEHLDIGYRWYDAQETGRCKPVGGRNPCVAFPFGHGLSYTRFSVSRPALSKPSKPGEYQMSVTVQNVGKVAGAEVVQAYLSLPASANGLGVTQPPKRLVGFERVALAPGESRRVSITIDAGASNHPLSVWDRKAKKWVVPTGKFTALVGTSSSRADLLSAGTFEP